MFDDFFVVFIFLTLIPIGAGFYSALVSTMLVPIYPAVLAGGTLKEMKSLVGMSLSFAIGFAVFTLTLNTIVYATYFPSNLLRSIAILLSALFGLLMIFANRFPISASELTKGMIYGLCLGLIWSTWVGPFMPQLDYYAPKSVDFYLTCLTFMFGLGAGLFILLLAYLVQKIIEWIKLSQETILYFRKFLGALMILIALSVVFNWISIPAREEFIHPDPHVSIHELFHLKKPQ